MKYAKIEEAIADSVAAARDEFVERLKKEQLLIPGFGPRREQGELDFSGIDDERFFEQAEARIVQALERFSKAAAGASAVRRRLCV